MLRPPQRFAVAAELDLSKVMEIARLGMENLAQQTLLDQVQTEHLGLVVTAVFHHDAMAPGLLGGLDELPVFIELYCFIEKFFISGTIIFAAAPGPGFS